MISSIKLGLGAALASLATVAFAQSQLEEAAKHEAGQLRFLLATSKQCAAFALPAPQMRPQYTKDALGRVNAARNEYGHDFTFEYSGSTNTPVAIIAYGKRVQIDVDADGDERLLEKLRARAILYSQVKKACGIESDAENSFRWEDEEWNCWRGGNGAGRCGSSVPLAWFETAFWSDYWMPSYNTPFSAVPAIPQCVTVCQSFCSDVSMTTAQACGTIASAVGVMATGIAGVLVGAACGTGTVIGYFVCRDIVCTRNCQN